MQTTRGLLTPTQGCRSDMAEKVWGPAGQREKAERERQSVERLKQWLANRPQYDPDGDTFAARGMDPRKDDPRVQAVHAYLQPAGGGSLAVGVIETLIEEGWLPPWPNQNWSDLLAKVEHFADFYGNAGMGTRNAYVHIAELIRGED